MQVMPPDHGEGPSRGADVDIMQGLGIVYIFENPQQFWSELEDILRIPSDVTLKQLDATMMQFVTFCSDYHEQYLSTPMQLEHSCKALLSSDLFAFHSERMCDLLLDDVQKCTNPHRQLIIYNILLSWGRLKPNFLRSHKRWQPLFPLLMDHIRVELDTEVEEAYITAATSDASTSATPRDIAIPIEVRLKFLSVQLLYESCRMQKLTLQDLDIFDDLFIDHLFDLAERTRAFQDESFNYAVIKLLVALNEQFMLSSLVPHTPQSPNALSYHKHHHHGTDLVVSKKPQEQNRVLRILMAKLASASTFGSDLIFMLNRAHRTAEDFVMQLLVLKLLYLLFTTKGTTDYFYTNDLRVLVDVFLREILDLDEANESLLHTYLRVLHPLLTKTPLRTMPYKRPEIMRALELLIQHENIRDVNPTTKRLVERCLSGDWCVQLRQANGHKARATHRQDSFDVQSVSSTSSSIDASRSQSFLTTAVIADAAGNKKTLKSSRSVEHLKSAAQGKSAHKDRALGEALRSGSNISSISLPKVATASVNPPSTRRRDRAETMEVEAPGTSRHNGRVLVLEDTVAFTHEPPTIVVQSPFSPVKYDPPESPFSQLSPPPHAATFLSSAPTSPVPSHRRAAPAPPTKRRKPPAIPTSKTKGVTIQTIASSASSPLSAGARSS